MIEGERNNFDWVCRGCKEHNHIDENGDLEDCVVFGSALPKYVTWCRHRNPYIPIKTGAKISKEAELDEILEKINSITQQQHISLKSIHYITAVLNGEHNLGEYKIFKLRIGVNGYFYKGRQLYKLIEDYMEKTLHPVNKPKVHIDLPEGIIVLNRRIIK